MDKFTHLHCHSEFSPDGCGRLHDLVKYTASIGQTSLALTDHGTMANMVDFYQSCKDFNVKPIFGLEGYLRAFDEEPGNPKVTHITILAKNEKGFNNLLRLNNDAHRNTFKRRSGAVPLIEYDMIEKHADGLIVLTGCVASAIHLGDYNFGKDYVQTLTRLVGHENVYGELMFTMSGQDFHTKVIEISKDLEIPLVITNDCHFIEKDHAGIHQIVVQARKGFTYESKNLYVMSYDEIKNHSLKFIDEKTFNTAIKNTARISESVEKFSIESEPILPHVTDEQINEFKNKLLNLFNNDILYCDEEVKELKRLRYDKEVVVFDEKGLWDYFYILDDLMTYCHHNGIKVNVRGSAGGCYLLYLMGITPIDPIRYNLLFERFYNKFREDYADVDVDIDILRRHEVLEYAKTKWNMIGVTNFVTYGHKSLIHDLCRVLKLPKEIETEAADNDENSEPFRKLCKLDPLFKPAYDVILGQIKNRSKHAGAIAPTGVRIIPLEQFNSSEPQIALSEGATTKMLSKVGVIKYDMLGVSKISELSLMQKLTGVTPPLHPDEYPPEVFDTICSGVTTGMFQLSSEGIQDLTSKLQPRTFEDLGLVLALYRPGALDNFNVDQIVEYKTKPRELHPVIDGLLDMSYSIMVYQEDVMNVYSTVTGGELEDSDLARRFLSPKSAKVADDPKWVEKKNELRDTFIIKGQENGYSLSLLLNLWEELEKFVRYGFNRSHAYSYAYLTLQDAWYRTYYPVEYYTALLSLDVYDGNSKAQEYIFDAIQLGVKIHKPHINVSTNTYQLKDSEIYLPLNCIKGLGEKSVNALITIREENGGKFNTFEEVMKFVNGRTLNKTNRQLLFQMGGFDGLEGDQTVLGLESYEISNSKQDEIDSLGILIPSPKIIDLINQYKDNPVVKVGFVSDINQKKTKTGKPMFAYKLSPFNTFVWNLVGDVPKLEKGTMVKIDCTDFRMIRRVVKYKLT